VRANVAFASFICTASLLSRKYGVTFEDIAEDVLNDITIWGEYAHYLKDVYVIQSGTRKGKHLKIHTLLNYFCVSLNAAAAKFKAIGSNQTKLFFTCLDDSSKTAAAQWLQGLKKNLKYELFKRAAEAGESVIDSATPVYGVDARAIVSVA